MRLKLDLKKKKVLVISDMHIPYHHKDSIRFLKALQTKYQFDLVVNIGDFLDFHNISFHPSDPDLLNAGDELKAARKYVKQIEKIFPKMIIVGSNHGDLPYRRFKAAGLPEELLRSYNDVYGVGKDWKFVDDLTIDSGGKLTYFVHGISKVGAKLAAQRGINCVQGHYHTEFRIDYISNPRDLLWSLQVGCLIDRKSLAFAYNKLDMNRPIIGCGGVLFNHPALFPMELTTGGEWNGVVS